MIHKEIGRKLGVYTTMSLQSNNPDRTVAITDFVCLLPNYLEENSPKYCLTASGSLIVNDKILLVKHKKLGIWLSPGGHVEVNEMPHQAAERECLEETGVHVKTIQHGFYKKSQTSNYLPSPISTNLHWINQDNYLIRIGQKQAEKDPRWSNRGCEVHLDYKYLLEPTSEVVLNRQIEETDGLEWFSRDQIADLETTDDIKGELVYAFVLL